MLYADESLRFFLSELFNMRVVHGFILNSFLNTTIVPICKNKNGNMSDTSNYRPVAVATVVLLTCLSLCNTQARAVNLIHAVLCDDECVTQAHDC